jgi:DHA2 family multidrug resistance protein
MIALAGFMVTLDAAICNVAIPTLSAGLAVSPHEGTWVITSYAVADAMTVPLAGWLAARFGPAASLAIGMAIFGASSAMCGLSTTLPMLVISRIIQGLAGGPMIPLTQAMMLSIFPFEKRNTATAVWGMTTTSGPVVGAILGGYICEYWSWPWIFLINVPVTIVVSVFIWRIMKRRDPVVQPRRMDVTGFCFMVVWIGAFQMMLDRGHDLDWFSSPLIVGLCITAIVGFAAFLIWVLTEEHPIVNLRVFRNRTFAVGAVITSIGFAVFFGAAVLSPLWLQTAMGYTQTWASRTAILTAVVGVMCTPIVTWCINRMDPRPLIFCGTLWMAGAYLWRGYFTTGVTFELVVFSQILIGIGMSFVFGPAMSLAFGAVKPQEIPNAAGVVAFLRTLSMAFSAAITTTKWQDGMAVGHARIVDGMSSAAGNSALEAAGVAADQIPWHLDRIVQDQAVMLATNNTYFMFACMVVVGAVVVWLAPRPRPRGTT